MFKAFTKLASDRGKYFGEAEKVERDEEGGDDQLRCTMDARAPIGLTAVDDTGHSTTSYPRPDGSIGKVVEKEVKVSA